MLPGEDGLTICRQIRETDKRLPILIVTAKGDQIDRIVGLELGADDYLAKPFNSRELLARLKSIIRRTQDIAAPPPQPTEERLEFLGWTLRPDARELRNPSGAHIGLTTADFELLHILVTHPQRVLSRELLIDQTRGWVADRVDRVIDVQISRLRRKLGDDPRNPTIIRTIRGDGYLFGPTAVVMFVAVGVFVVTAERWKTDPVYRLPPPEQVASVAAAFEQTPPSAHDDLIRALTDSTQIVVMLPTLPEVEHSIATEKTAARYREALKGRPFRILASDPRAPDDYGRRPVFSTGRLQVAAALADGRSVAVSQMATPTITQIINRSLLFVALVVGVNLSFALLIAAQTRRPVDRLLRAVRADQPEQFSVSGPREIVALGVAFRDLRNRLQTVMDERTRMVAAIAHDFRTYLTRMDLRSDFIIDDRQRLSASRDIAEMNGLIDDTLLYAQGLEEPAGEPPECDVAALLREIALQREALGQVIVLRGVDAPAQACITPVSLSRIMANLLDNALRHGGGSASVTLAVALDSVVILVDDRGPGVPEVELAKLTEPFHRLEASRSRDTGGVGLGLSIVQALVSRHGGHLSLHNRPQGGLRAQLQLRASPGSVEITSRNNHRERA
ncbi:hypothetical protein LTR94_024798 [Friedmanniomyces endolithicus]|nr:hypothetical protein LTR94_024798 [Friedmanniomyces endolithicus]